MHVAQRLTPVVASPHGGAESPDRARSVPLEAPIMVVWPFGEIEHDRGSLIIGRSNEADIVLDDPLASRTHARLILGEHGVIVEDLHSSNGLFVNGVRVALRSAPLKEGDRLLVGTTEIGLFSALNSATLAIARAVSLPPGEDEPLELVPCEPHAPANATPALPSFEAKTAPTTTRSGVVDMIGHLAQRLLTSGRRDEAVRVLSEHLKAVSLGVTAGLAVPDEVLHQATTHALDLFEWTRLPEWVNYVFELHLRCQRLVDAEHLGALQAALALAGDGVDVRLIEYCLESLWSRWNTMSSDERARFTALATLVPRL